MMLFTEMRDVDLSEVHALCERIAAMPVPAAEIEYYPRRPRQRKRIREPNDGLAFAGLQVREWNQLLLALGCSGHPISAGVRDAIQAAGNVETEIVTVWCSVASWTDFLNQLLRRPGCYPGAVASKLVGQIMRTRRDVQ